MTDVDRQLQRSSELLRRHSEGGRSLAKRARDRRNADIMRRLGRVTAADLAIIVAAMVLGWFVPLGAGGAMIVLLLLAIATLGFAIFPLASEPRAETLAQVELKRLPLHTEQWLESQRKALPAPALRLADDIGVKLDMLAPQLATLDEREPAAAEVRRLVGEQLPELVKGYTCVPQSLRGHARDGGKSPDAQLVDGLRLIDAEIGDMTQKLAEGDLNLLATRTRYLEIAYRDERESGAL